MNSRRPIINTHLESCRARNLISFTVLTVMAYIIMLFLSTFFPQ